MLPNHEWLTTRFFGKSYSELSANFPQAFASASGELCTAPIASDSDPPVLADYELLTTRFFGGSFSEQLPRSFQLVPSGLTGVRFYNQCQVSQRKSRVQLLGGENRQAMSHNKHVDGDLASKGGCQN